MTVEEAISVLENKDVSLGIVARIGQDTEYWRKLRPALNMALSALRAQQEHENNAPLTIDDLLEMVGDPVWTVGVSYTKDGTFSMWDIIESVNENGIQFGYSNEYPEWWNYGLKTPDGKLCGWLAYRHKPEEVE